MSARVRVCNREASSVHLYTRMQIARFRLFFFEEGEGGGGGGEVPLAFDK